MWSMSHTIPIEEAASKLEKLVNELSPGDEIVLTRGSHPVARLVSTGGGNMAMKRRVPGACKGMITINGDLNDDSEVHEMFKEYM